MLYHSQKQMNMKTLIDAVHKALEIKTGQAICAIHDEANKYAFKTVDGKWHTVDMKFANDAASTYLTR